jgi:hypothetical protein
MLPMTGYQRRLIISYDAEGKLIQFEDLWGSAANRQVLRPAPGVTTMPGDRSLVVSILRNPGRCEYAFPAKLLRRLRAKTSPADAEMQEVTDADTEDDLEPQRPVLPDGRLMHDGFGDKPPEVTARQYEAIKRLHHNLAHPANTSLMRMLRRWGAQPAVLKCVKELKCHVCSEIRMPQPSRRAGLKPATHFNHWVSFDETEVILSDGSTINVLIIVCEASNYTVAVPMHDVHRVPSWEQVKTALELGWLLWAGPPENMRFDSLRAHLAEAARRFCAEHGCTGHPTPAEAHNANALAENRVDFFKHHFIKLNQECQLTQEDEPYSWCGKLTGAQNAHLRYGGFSPNQYVFGRDPRIPASLLTDEGRLEDGRRDGHQPSTDSAAPRPRGIPGRQRRLLLARARRRHDEPKTARREGLARPWRHRGEAGD